MPIMSQVILPPTEPQPEPQPEAPAPSTTTALIPQPPAPEPERPKYVYEYVPPPQPRAWRAVKWPLRQFFKGLILTGSAAKRHKIVTLVILALLIGGAGATYGVYRATHPSTPTTSAAGGGTALPPGAQQPETPFTIVNSSAPPLSTSVIHWLHAWKTHDGQEAWNALSSTAQTNYQGQGIDETAVQQRLDQDRVQGIEYDQFIYTGGYFYPDGSSNYTVEVIQRMPSGSHAISTWIFLVGSDNSIEAWLPLSQ
jgi:hypothetical protein